MDTGAGISSVTQATPRAACCSESATETLVALTMVSSNGASSWNPTSREAGDPDSDDLRVLTSWIEIAQYMRKGVRTVQRWERDFGLPVRRLSGGSPKRAVIAHPMELDAWVALHCQQTQHENCAEDRGSGPAGLHHLIQEAAALRLENRLLLSEFRVALGALHQTLSSMSSARAKNDNGHS
ncbi:MAG: hypothetical protein ACLGXA_08200 [Acidobacteriota bacterium]